MRYLFKKLADGERLRADLLARAALDAISGRRAVGRELSRSLAARYLSRKILVIGSEYVRDLYSRRASCNAVFALGALNEIYAADYLAKLCGRVHLLARERNEIRHSGYVIVEHSHISHARKHHKYLGEGCGVANSKGRLRATREARDLLCRLVGKIYKATALNGFHNDDLLAVLYCNVVALLALYAGIVVVKVIYLKLYSLDAVVFRKYHIKHVGGIVEGHSDMSYLALGLELLDRLKGLASLVLLIVGGVKTMEKIKIKVFNAAKLELALKEGAYVLCGLKIGVGKLVGKNEGIARVSCRETVADSSLALSVKVAVRGVEIVKARTDEGVYHSVELVVIDLVVFHREAHTAKSKILFDLIKAIFHFKLLLSLLVTLYHKNREDAIALRG